jgi:hypothetical protein
VPQVEIDLTVDESDDEPTVVDEKEFDDAQAVVLASILH